MTSAPDFSTLWYTRCQVPTASGIALSLGWFHTLFASLGIGFGVLQDAPLEIALSHYDHSLPTLIREGGNVPAIVARAGGAPTRLIGLTFVDEGQAIVVRAEHLGEDLCGKRIALPAFASNPNASHARAMALCGFEAALASGGLRFSDVQMVETPLADTIPPGRLRRDLGIVDWPSIHQVADGLADAAYIKGAAARRTARDLGLVALVEIDELPVEARVNNGTPRPITVHAALLDHRPEWVIDFMAVTLAASQWAVGNRSQAMSILAHETGSQVDGSRSLFLENMDGITPTLSEDRLGLLDRQIRRLATHGFLIDKFEVDAWSEPNVLLAAADRMADVLPTDASI